MSSPSITKNINRHPNEVITNRENIRLIYLDNSPPTLEIQTKLLEINPSAQFYTDIQLCLDFFQSIFNEEIFLIISNILSTDILDTISSLQSILSIFIYDDQQQNYELKNKYPQIIDIYTNLNDLFQSIEEHIQLIDKQIFIYNFFDPNTQDLTNESASFLWHQMLINILREIPHNKFQREDILNKCSQYYQTNSSQLNKIELFRRNYTCQQSIQWYINECFIYKLLNRALAIEDMEFLYSFRFFIIDLCCEIEKQYKNMNHQEYLIVYRGQMMFKEEIEKFQQNIGCFISINGFFLTSRNQNLSLSLFKQHFSNKENVLLEIHVDLSKETIILTDISSLNSTSTEQDILFHINSLFQIDSIEYEKFNNLWKLKLIATNNGIKHIDDYLKSIQKELDYRSSSVYFGHLLAKNLNRMKPAKIYFQILSKLLPNNHIDIPDIYMELGYIYDEMKEFSLALNKYQYALNIRQKQIPNEHSRIAVLLNYIGMTYKHMGNIERAIDFYGQSLYIYETKCSKNKNQLQRADTICNLGLAYRDKNEFNTALSYLNLAYNLRRDILSKDHLLLANSLSNIGNIYHDINDLDQAFNYYQQALTIQEISYSNNHLNKAIIFRDIALIYRDKQDWSNALIYFNKTLDIRQHLLSNINHPDIAICYGDIGNIYENMDNLDLALDNYQRQFQIEQQCLPFNHINHIIHFDLIINLLKKKDQSEQAIELCQKQLLKFKNLLGNDYENHPRIASILVLIATIYEDKNPKQADQHYQQALAILENKKHEEILQICLSPMTNFYWKCRMFDRALICQMKLLNLRRATLSTNHNDIAYTLQGLARLYRAMNKPNEALHYFHQSLNILQANYGLEHSDVKNIQHEIFDLKDMVHSIPLTANEDDNNPRLLTIDQQLEIIPHDNHVKFSPSTSNIDKKNQSSTTVTKSAFCVII